MLLFRTGNGQGNETQCWPLARILHRSGVRAAVAAHCTQTRRTHSGCATPCDMITQVSNWSECCMHAPSHAGADAVNTPCALNRFDAEGLDANRGVCTPSDGGGTTCLPCGGRGRFGPGPLQCCPFDKTGCGTFLLGFCSDDRECVTCGTAGDDYSSDAPCCSRAQLLSAMF